VYIARRVNNNLDPPSLPTCKHDVPKSARRIYTYTFTERIVVERLNRSNVFPKLVIGFFFFGLTDVRSPPVLSVAALYSIATNGSAVFESCSSTYRLDYRFRIASRRSYSLRRRETYSTRPFRTFAYACRCTRAR